MSKRIFAICLTITSMLGVFTLPAHATRPLFDLIELDGVKANVWGKEGWLSQLENNRLLELRRAQRCSAIGGPRGKYKVLDQRLFLTGMYVCGKDISLEEIYGSKEVPMLATWITDTLVTYRGKRLCGDEYGISIYEKTITLQVEKGLIKNVSETNNLNNPAIPTAEDVRKYLKAQGQEKDIAQAEQIVKDGGFFCLKME